MVVVKRGDDGKLDAKRPVDVFWRRFNDDGERKELSSIERSMAFGVKADPAWHGDVLYINTREFLNGAWTTVAARWRKYTDWQDCMDDHAAFLHQNRRYAACFSCTTGDAFAKAVAKAGYATDPNYAAKLISIIGQHQLADLDGGS